MIGLPAKLMPVRSKQRWAIAAISVLLLSGCSAGDDHSDSQDSAGDQQQSSSASGQTGAVDNSVEVTRTVDYYPEIHEKNGQNSTPSDSASADSAKDQITIGLGGIKVEGKLATLTLTFTPHLSDHKADEPISIYDMFDSSSPSITLIDVENLKRYSVASADSGGLLASDEVYTQTLNDQPVVATYTFAVPAVDVVDVYINERDLFDKAQVTR